MLIFLFKWKLLQHRLTRLNRIWCSLHILSYLVLASVLSNPYPFAKACSWRSHLAIWWRFQCFVASFLCCLRLLKIKVYVYIYICMCVYIYIYSFLCCWKWMHYSSCNKFNLLIGLQYLLRDLYTNIQLLLSFLFSEFPCFSLYPKENTLTYVSVTIVESFLCMCVKISRIWLSRNRFLKNWTDR